MDDGVDAGGDEGDDGGGDVAPAPPGAVATSCSVDSSRGSTAHTTPGADAASSTCRSREPGPTAAATSAGRGRTSGLAPGSPVKGTSQVICCAAYCLVAGCHWIVVRANATWSRDPPCGVARASTAIG